MIAAPPHPVHGRARRLLRAAQAWSLGLAIALGAAELVVRWRCGSPLPERRPLVEIRANPHRGWEMMPNSLHYTYVYPVRVNNLGLRGADIGPKRPGERRVFALGDSLLYGQGVSDDETIPAHLERELRGAGGPERDVTVVNGGLRAYSTNQELGMLRELAAQVKPDLVLVFWYVNDLGERDIEATYRDLAVRGPITFDVGARMEGSALWGWRAKQLLRRSALVMEAYDVVKKFRATPNTREFLDAGFARMEGYFAEFARLGGERGWRTAIVPVPDPNALLRDHAALRETERMTEVAGRHGLAVIDPIEEVRALAFARGRTPLVPYDGHYDGEANSAIARRVAAELGAMGWLGAERAGGTAAAPPTGEADPGGGPGAPSGGTSRSSGSGTRGSR